MDDERKDISVQIASVVNDLIAISKDEHVYYSVLVSNMRAKVYIKDNFVIVDVRPLVEGKFSVELHNPKMMDIIKQHVCRSLRQYVNMQLQFLSKAQNLLNEMHIKLTKEGY